MTSVWKPISLVQIIFFFQKRSWLIFLVLSKRCSSYFFVWVRGFFFLPWESFAFDFFFFWRIVPFSSHGPYAEKGEDKIGIGLISDTVVQTVLLDIHIIGPKYRCVSLQNIYNWSTNGLLIDCRTYHGKYPCTNQKSFGPMLNACNHLTPTPRTTLSTTW